MLKLFTYRDKTNTKFTVNLHHFIAIVRPSPLAQPMAGVTTETMAVFAGVQSVITEDTALSIEAAIQDYTSDPTDKKTHEALTS